jgi:hypothetical protein
MIWLVYDLQLDSAQNHYGLVKTRAVYTMFAPTLATLTEAVAGDVQIFTAQLQSRLNQRLGGGAPASQPAANDEVVDPDMV